MVGNRVGAAVVAQANNDCCGFKETWGSNQGPVPNRVQSRWGWPSGGYPWCACAVADWVAKAGAWDVYGGYTFLSPATHEMHDAAVRKGWVWKQSQGKIPHGSVWVKDGVHTALIVQDLGNGLVQTIGGNESGGVRLGVKSIWGSGVVVVVPPGIVGKPAPKTKTEFWLEDPTAKPYVMWHGKSKAGRDRLLAKWQNDPAYRQVHPRPHRKGTGANTRYYIIGGALRFYGPFDDRNSRDRAKRLIENRLGHSLRAYKKIVKV